MKLYAIGIAAVVLFGMSAGCQQQQSADGLNPQQQVQANRLDTITKAADGDWNKVPAADKSYILSTFTYGDENAARMMLLAKSGKLKAHPGAPPAIKPKH